MLGFIFQHHGSHMGSGGLSCNWCPSDLWGILDPFISIGDWGRVSHRSPNRQRAIAARITGRLRGGQTNVRDVYGWEFPAQAERITSSEHVLADVGTEDHRLAPSTPSAPSVSLFKAPALPWQDLLQAFRKKTGSLGRSKHVGATRRPTHQLWHGLASHSEFDLLFGLVRQQKSRRKQMIYRVLPSSLVGGLLFFKVFYPTDGVDDPYWHSHSSRGPKKNAQEAWGQMEP